jgi:hypothetical protein
MGLGHSLTKGGMDLGSFRGNVLDGIWVYNEENRNYTLDIASANGEQLRFILASFPSWSVRDIVMQMYERGELTSDASEAFAKILLLG